MAEDSLDIYIRNLVLEALRHESREIHIRQSGDQKPKLEFLWHEELIDFPHPPQNGFGDLMTRLREMAKLPAESPGGEEQANIEIKRRDDTIGLGMYFTTDADGTFLRIEIKNDVAVHK